MKQEVSPLGKHVLLDVWGVENLTSIPLLEAMIIEAAQRAGATVLDKHFHTFTGGGVTGVAILAESHISVHTWPETAYAAFDIFMCGNCEPEVAADYILAVCKPSESNCRMITRGELAAVEA